ncbi:hypothetical protein [Romboutsia ilealis]|uniref:hypothetical protein n=1 Tax=Romboutsia ilealis TaxID=1115758 RepID=UPI00272DB61C|nr:hypothetical protein [Romboutsia ilealis]
MKKLDHKDKTYFNYSTEDGKNAQDILRDRITLGEKSICDYCETENNKGLYCKSCGASLDEAKIVEKKRSIKAFKVDIKPILLTSVTSVATLFLISLGLKLLMSFNLGELINFINSLHIILGINLGTINLNLSTMMNSGSVIMHLGVLVIALIPLLVLSLYNVIFIKNKNTQDLLYNSVGVGATYGLMLVIISIFSSTSSSISQMMNYGISVAYRYKILELFSNGFILGFISTYLIGYKKKYFGQNIYLDILKKAINSILILYVLVFIILLTLYIFDNSYLYELGVYNYSKNNAFILSQLASYILTFANIIPTTIGSNKLSILTIINGDLLFDTKLILIAIILLALLVLILTGYNLKKKFKNSSVNIVLIFSICYSIIIAILSSFSAIYIGGNISLLKMSNYSGNTFMGSGIFTTLIISFIYSYIIVKIGYTLSDFE